MLTRQPNILFVTGNTECGCLLENLSALGAVTTTQTLPETLRQLKSGDFDVLFCAWEFRGGAWADLLASLKRHGLELPTVIFYRCGGEAEWMKALQAGAFDLLAPPFDLYKLRVLLEHAMTSGGHVQQVA